MENAIKLPQEVKEKMVFSIFYNLKNRNVNEYMHICIHFS